MDGVLGRLDGPEIVCDSVRHSRPIPEKGCKIPPVPLLDRRYQGNLKISNSQCSTKSNISSLESEVTVSARTQGGMSPSQLAAAFPRHVSTSAAFGRNFLSPFQQRWMKFQRKSENPIADAFSGLFGRSPRTTDHPNSVGRTPRNGISPVRT